MIWMFVLGFLVGGISQAWWYASTDGKAYVKRKAYQAGWNDAMRVAKDTLRARHPKGSA